MANIQEEIVISGGGASGKTLFATAICRYAERAMLTVKVSDNDLFTFRESFDEDLKMVRLEHGVSGADLSIIVIDNQSLDMNVTFARGMSFELAHAIFE
jgi:DNA replication protein DnaC